jgi:imidazolonepropionase-like amidohydrolase
MNSATQIGVMEVSSAEDSVDSAVKSGPLGAAFDLQYALNPNSELIAMTRADGVTRVVTLPTASAGAPFAGQGMALRLSDGEDLLERPHLAMAVAVGGATSRQAGGSRSAQWQILRNALDEARLYRARGARARQALEPRDQILNHLDADALLPVLDGRMPLAISAQRESDLRQAIALRHDYGVRVIIVGGAEAWRVADLLAAADIPVVLDPLANLPYSLDQVGARLDNAARLQKAGVIIAFALTDPYSAIYTSLLAGVELREAAGIAVASGLTWDQALKAVTVNPARIWGLQGDYGTLTAGREADLVIWHGDPLDVSGWPDLVLVRGRAVSLTTRQQALSRRYAPDRAADAWPPAYR